MKKLLSLATATVLGTITIPNINSNIKTELINSNYYNIIHSNINYSFHDSYNGALSDFKDNSNTYTLLKWSDYADSWDNFKQNYKTIYFDKQSLFKISLSTGKNKFPDLTYKMPTNFITENQGSGDTNSLYYIKMNETVVGFANYMEASLNIWHDNENIYFKWFLRNISTFGRDSYSDVKLNTIYFEKN